MQLEAIETPVSPRRLPVSACGFFSFFFFFGLRQDRVRTRAHVGKHNYVLMCSDADIPKNKRCSLFTSAACVLMCLVALIMPPYYRSPNALSP